MRVALVNPRWDFAGSIYFGCRSAHLPIELARSRDSLVDAGHDVAMFDGHLFDSTHEEIASDVKAFAPDMIVVSTAPTFLFWRCAQPELRVPRACLDALRGTASMLVAIGPHGSTTPRAALRKLNVDVVIMGEPEDVVVAVAEGDLDVPGLCRRVDGDVRVQGGPVAARFVDARPLAWPDRWIERHTHHHHRFDATPTGPGAEIEASRGCPFHCTFCAKEAFRDTYRRRRTESVLAEVALLRRQGVEYVYFIDEIFLADRDLLEGMRASGVKFGVQTRIDLWKPDQLEVLGRAGCVSIEAGVESLTPRGRQSLAKKCRLDDDALTARLVAARRHVPFVQANLLAVADDDAEEVRRWRATMRDRGIWSNDPVPLFPYPGSPEYRRLWGVPDDDAWERAHAHYLSLFSTMSDIQDARPAHLHALERGCC